jgi:hypothetical protein
MDFMVVLRLISFLAFVAIKALFRLKKLLGLKNSFRSIPQQRWKYYVKLDFVGRSV